MRGGGYMHANPSVSVLANTGAGSCAGRWLRDGQHLTAGSWLIAAQGLSIPMPGVNWIDTSCPAGTHFYMYQVIAGSGCTVFSNSNGDSGFLAAEIG